MTRYSLPEDEVERLKAVHNSHLLYMPMNKVFENVIGLTKEIFDVPMVAITLIDSDTVWIISSIGLKINQIPRKHSLCARTILENEVVVIEDTLADKVFADNPYVKDSPHIRFYAGSVIHGENNKHIGTLCIIDTIPRCLSSDEILVLQDMSARIDLEIKNHCLIPGVSPLVKDPTHLNKQALVDDVTHLWNKNGLTKLLNLQIQMSGVKKTTFGLMMLNIDDFSAINYKYGWEKGNMVLKDIARLLLISCRDTDVIGRWEGDKFLMIISLEERSQILLVARRIQKQIRENKIKIDNEEVILDASIGLVFFNENRNLSEEELINQLTKAIQTGKRNGKSQFVVG